MLALLGLMTMLALLGVILAKRMSALAALIAIPIIGALIGGFGIDTGKFIVQGVQSIAPVVAMFIFAIIFFGILTDAGMFDPVISKILRVVGNHPTRIVMGSALLAMLVHLDGSGAVTFLITIPALLPLYERLNMDKRVLARTKADIDEMVERIVPAMRERGGYIPTIDHGTPEETPYEHYLHYRARMVELGG